MKIYYDQGYNDIGVVIAILAAIFHGNGNSSSKIVPRAFLELVG